MTTDLATYLRTLPDRCAGCGFHRTKQGCQCPEREFERFCAMLRQAADAAGRIDQTALRRLTRGSFEPKHIGQLTRRARRERVIEQVGHEPSTDVSGGNALWGAGEVAWADKLAKSYRLT